MATLFMIGPMIGRPDPALLLIVPDPEFHNVRDDRDEGDISDQLLVRGGSIQDDGGKVQRKGNLIWWSALRGQPSCLKQDNQSKSRYWKQIKFIMKHLLTIF